VSRQSSIRSIRELHPQPTPCDEPDEYFSPNGLETTTPGPSHFLAPGSSHNGQRKRVISLTVESSSRHASLDSISTPNSAYSPVSSTQERLWEKHTTPLPTPRRSGSPDGLLSTREWDVARSTPREDGAVSPALSSGSKTDMFFAASQSEALPTPPRPVGRAPSIGKGLPAGIRGHDRTVSLPTKIHIGAIETPTPPAPLIDSIRRPFGLSQEVSSTGSRLQRVQNQSPIQVPPVSGGPTDSARRPTLHVRRESQQLPRELREVPVDAAILHPGDELVATPNDRRWPKEASPHWRLLEPLGQGAFSAVWSAEDSSSLGSAKPLVAAVKLTSRATCSTNSRTGIAFVREVSVLRHLSHPNIISFISSFSTSTHHCLVLERLSGGELFNLMSDEENRRRMIAKGPGNDDGEAFVRRLFGELCKGIGWLHEVGVVHRDIKLESESSCGLDDNPHRLPTRS
jgi:tRNA (cytidine32/guanosine34-2'-O)-methyltransferase